MDQDPFFNAKKKKFLEDGTVKGLVDPYCIVKFAGQEGKTMVVNDCYDPMWNEEIWFPTSVRHLAPTCYSHVPIKACRACY